MVTKVVGAWPQPDGVTLEEVDGVLRVKDNGIGLDKLNNSSRLLYLSTSTVSTTSTSLVDAYSTTLPSDISSYRAVVAVVYAYHKGSDTSIYMSYIRYALVVNGRSTGEIRFRAFDTTTNYVFPIVLVKELQSGDEGATVVVKHRTTASSHQALAYGCFIYLV